MFGWGGEDTGRGYGLSRPGSPTLCSYLCSCSQQRPQRAERNASATLVTCHANPATHRANRNPARSRIFRQTTGRAEPSELFSETPAASWSRPPSNKRGAIRGRPQPIFLKGWLRVVEACPGPILHAQPGPPRKSRRAPAPPPTAAETLPAVAPALGWRMRYVADLVPSSPAGRNPDPFPYSMPFRPAIDRGPHCF